MPPSTRKSHRPSVPPGNCTPGASGTRGWCIRTACALEAAAAKPGNVHPGNDYPDLSYAELTAAGAAIAAAFDAAPRSRLGATIHAAVTASRAVTRSNANLGIVLATSPLAAVPEGCSPTASGAAAVLAALTPEDARDCWTALAVACPGGMGTRDRWDLAGDAPADLLAAMRVAAGYDQIARLWAHGYEPLFSGPVADIEHQLLAGHDLADAIVRSFLLHLSREPDSLIARKHGPAVAAAVSARAGDVIGRHGSGWRGAALDLDRDLRRGLGIGGFAPTSAGVVPGTINPGTTADLVAAALYVLLVSGRLQELCAIDPPTVAN